MGEGEKNGEDGAISRMSRLLKAQVGDEGLITEADYVCATLLELELIDEDVLTKVREQFYRLDTRAAGCFPERVSGDGVCEDGRCEG